MHVVKIHTKFVIVITDEGSRRIGWTEKRGLKNFMESFV